MRSKQRMEKYYAITDTAKFKLFFVVFIVVNFSHLLSKHPFLTFRLVSSQKPCSTYHKEGILVTIRCTPSSAPIQTALIGRVRLVQ